MSIQKILEMAEKFVTLADEGTVIKTPHNMKYEDQRNRLSKFYDHFTRQLRIIINEMEGDIWMLRQRKFDPNLLKIFPAIRERLITLFKSIDEARPYIAAEKLVFYVTNRSTKMVQDNLNFLAKHHLQITNEDFVPSPRMQHPQVHSLDALNKLATELKDFMEKNPLIVPPGATESETPTKPPPARERALFGPENELGPQDKTKV